VLFTEEFTVLRGGIISFDVVEQQAVYRNHVTDHGIKL